MSGPQDTSLTSHGSGDGGTSKDLLDRVVSTSILLKFLEIFEGAELKLSQIIDISNGVIDFVTGHVVTQNYATKTDKASGSKTVVSRQVQIQTAHEGNFTLTTNESVKLSDSAIKSLRDTNNTYLFNKTDDIYVNDKSLEFAQDLLQEASRYGQQVTCVYDQSNGDILLVRIISNPTSISNDNRSFPYILSASGPGVPSPTPQPTPHPTPHPRR
ncbi:hypothetical protein [Acaryochloris marina]|uniref:Uncharacterized protein n=1 Tax=Acaryochloris marina (strain MBIC 11017) TaxID=329726 RepID=B0C4Q5_ACAM1|nr:hypothetical protein [Acaryochloris marina]ABW29938.1 hypothetical protein AM1_4967 [Acaryochloris marina MBIC11017]BDM78812.1 hypothetical protein AM10699_16810 [Acaryochloris marina MBIC10699]